MSEELRREFGLGDLILFHITAIVTVRWISFAAARGPSSMGLWALSFLLFLLPITYSVLDLTRKMPEQGGLYQWTKKTLGPAHGFICAWCYIVNNLFYYPSLLIATAGYFAWTIAKQGLEANLIFTIAFSTIVIVGIIILNYIGLKIGKWIENIGGLSIWIPCSLLILFALVHYLKHGSANPLSFGGFLPDFSRFDTFTAWSSICFAFTGIELASTMSGEVKNPERNLPRSIYLGGAAITVIYMLGTLAVLIIVPPGKINLITGIVQAIDTILSQIGVPQLTQVVALLLTLGALGTLGAWIAGVARMPYSMGVDRFFPEALGKIHPRFRTPYIALVWLGIISLAIMALSFAAGSGKVKDVYILLVNATIIIYFIPYLYLFISHMVYNWRNERKILPNILGVAGMISTTIAIILTFFPSDTPNPLSYRLNLGIGSAVGILLGVVIYVVRRKSVAVS
ncbi:MAG TPA: APC family permease [Acidobacteriota bacterium]|nr:APC family permease [Acidobacteriota bacterium]